jgi:hypothetical protein
MLPEDEKERTLKKAGKIAPESGNLFLHLDRKKVSMPKNSAELFHQDTRPEKAISRQKMQLKMEKGFSKAAVFDQAAKVL